nr:transposon Ty3-I Gag-Pol polyprotein [Tanacetum cinerariifolium]
MNFMVVRSQSSYNEIIRRPGVKKLQAVLSTAHRMLKILVEGGVITLKSSKLVPLECAMVSGPGETPSAAKPIIEERVKVAINPEYPEQSVMIGSTLIEGGQNKLCGLLQRNLDIFAWKPTDMTGVPRHIVEHRLNVREGCSPVRQKKKLENLWGRNNKRNRQKSKVYVDDLIIKSHTKDEIVRDVEEAFRTLREINMKLNTKKCAFRVKEGMFLGYKFNAKGLKVCPDRVDVILSLPSLKYLKDVQKLNGKLASLIAEEVFKQMKQLIAELPMLTAPIEKEELIVYLAVTKWTVSAVLMTKREAKQMPIYFVSRALRGPEQNYTSMEKLSRTNTYKPKRDGGHLCSKVQFDATNNEAEYEALIVRLRIVKQMGVKKLQENVDSRLVANQGILNQTNLLEREQKSDALSKIASTSFAHLSKQVLVEELKEKSISEIEILAVVEEESDTWMDPLFKYLAEGTLPADVKKAMEIRRKSWRFAVINETIYKKTFLGSWLRCVGPLQANYVLKEIHEGSCSMHAGTRSIVAKALQTGYYWPTMHKDVRMLIRACSNSMERLSQIMENSSGTMCSKIGAKNYQGLDANSKNWIEEVPHVLWAYRTMIQLSNRDTSFSLTYETEAVIPAEIGIPTLKTAKVDLVGNNEALEINLDLLEERREEAAIREAKTKAKIEKYNNSKVRNTSFKPRDLVYRNNDASRAKDTGKLGPKWEGPYEVTEALSERRIQAKGP